ncbi:carboxymuconolactone decarboxylase family protein [Cohnella sp. LGH]|nr:carboxymuconolactone decarboxylase family protein [Cohnella sp. LGH]
MQFVAYCRPLFPISSARESFGEFAPAFVSYSEDALFGDMWRREGLSLRDRGLITIAALVAGGMTEQLTYHLQLAADLARILKAE